MQKCLHFSSLGRVGGCKSRDDAKVLAFRKMSKAKGKADTALPWANRKYNRFKGQLKTQETEFKLKTLNLNTHSKTVSQTDHDMSSG
ncbi:hypothetical protein TB2_011286 [Malus domestica]